MRTDGRTDDDKLIAIFPNLSAGGLKRSGISQNNRHKKLLTGSGTTLFWRKKIIPLICGGTFVAVSFVLCSLLFNCYFV